MPNLILRTLSVKKGSMPMPDAVYRGVLKTYNFGSATNSLSWPDLKRVRAAR